MTGGRQLNAWSVRRRSGGLAMLFRNLAIVAAAIFIGGLVYSQYSLARVALDRRRNGGSGWIAPWQLATDRNLSERGKIFRARYLRSILISLVSFVVCVAALELSG
jgi:hypothetical protein